MRPTTKTAFLLNFLAFPSIFGATLTLKPISDPSNFATAFVSPPNTTAASDGVGGICTNSGQGIRRFNPSLPGLIQVADNSSSYAYINPSPRFPDSMRAALVCNNGGAVYLTYSSGGTALTIKVYGSSKPTFLKTGDALIGYNGPGSPNPNVNFGTFQDVFGLSWDFELGVGMYYYPADDPGTIYQGIFRVTPGSLAPIALLTRFKLTDGKKLVLESGNGLLWVSNLTDKTLTAYDGSGRAVISRAGLVSESVVSAITTSQNISVVAYTNVSGLQIHRFSGPGQSTEETLVSNGQISGHTLGPITAIAAVENGFYAITQLSPGIKALVSVLDGTYSELLREDQQPSGQMFGIFASGGNIYFEQTNNGKVTLYQAFANYGAVVDHVENAASYETVTTLTRNTWMSVRGTGLALSCETASTAPFPDTLGGTRVLIRIAGGQVSAPLNYACDGQINFLVPDIGSVTTTSVAVKLSNSSATVEMPFTVVRSSPAPFNWGSFPIFQDSITYRVLQPGEPLQDGTIYTMYWNGLGPTAPSVPVNTIVPVALYPLTQPISLRIANQESEVLFVGLTPLSIGLYQVNFRHHLSGGMNDPFTASGRLTMIDGTEARFPVMVQ